MINFKTKKIALATTLALSSSIVAAQSSTESTDITLEVLNGFALAEVSALNFGTVRATQTFDVDSGNGDAPAFNGGEKGAGLQIVPNVATPVSVAEGAHSVGGGAGDAEINSDMSSLVAGAPGEYSISGAAPGVAMTITPPAEFSLTDGTTAAFDVNIAATDIVISGGPNDGVTYDNAAPNAITDGTGTVNFLVGGTITIDEAINGPIADGTYTGDYVITVSY